MAKRDTVQLHSIIKLSFTDIFHIFATMFSKLFSADFFEYGKEWTSMRLTGPHLSSLGLTILTKLLTIYLMGYFSSYLLKPFWTYKSAADNFEHICKQKSWWPLIVHLSYEMWLVMSTTITHFVFRPINMAWSNLVGGHQMNISSKLFSNRKDTFWGEDFEGLTIAIFCKTA